MSGLRDGYQPSIGLDQSDPPRGGSGVPNRTPATTRLHFHRDSVIACHGLLGQRGKFCESFGCDNILELLEEVELAIRETKYDCITAINTRQAKHMKKLRKSGGTGAIVNPIFQEAVQAIEEMR